LIKQKKTAQLFSRGYHHVSASWAVEMAEKSDKREAAQQNIDKQTFHSYTSTKQEK
jgi:hypothetical protein